MKANYNILWSWWLNASLANQRDCIAQIISGGWLKSLPVIEQVRLFEYAPPEVKKYLPKWDAIHPHTLTRLGLKVPRDKMTTLLKRQ